ncbi:MAG: type II toxin-antitoxin system VapC family toxin [Nitrospira sp.]|nr:type II toxin-antitoxin system VapC family toxin [Nitrospira sp.]
MYYWDTSALVKQFIQEIGTDDALALRADTPPHATATITYTETFSAFRRRVREAVLKEPHYCEVVRRFIQEWSAYVRINLDESILERSRVLLERYRSALSTPFISRQPSSCKSNCTNHR